MSGGRVRRDSRWPTSYHDCIVGGGRAADHEHVLHGRNAVANRLDDRQAVLVHDQHARLASR